MPEVTPLDSNGLEDAYFRLYRDFFDMAERNRRWNLRDDIPWEQANHSMNPAIADIVESFCAVELYLPDYHGQEPAQDAGQARPGVVLRQLGL